MSVARIRHLSPRVTAVLGLNPSRFTLDGTNTYLVGTGEARILVDTGEGVPEYVDLLREAMKECGCRRIQEVLFTHYHHDHVGGLPSLVSAFGSLPVSKLCVDPDESDPSPPGPGPAQAESGSRHTEGAHAAGDGYSHTGVPQPFAASRRFGPQDAEGVVFRTEGATLRPIFTPGHTADHTAFLLEEEEALFTGDCVLGAGTAVFEDLRDYMASLELLLDRAPRRLYPGHGPVIEAGADKIKEYLAHRRARESQVLGVLRGVGSEAMSPMDIVKIVYTETPPALHPAAASNVRHHLEKLAKDDVVVRADERADTWRLRAGSRL